MFNCIIVFGFVLLRIVIPCQRATARHMTA